MAYEQALMVLFHYPDIWLDFARWHHTGGGGGPAAALVVLDKGRAALPTALALHFAAADMQVCLLCVCALFASAALEVAGCFGKTRTGGAAVGEGRL